MSLTAGAVADTPPGAPEGPPVVAPPFVGPPAVNPPAAPPAAPAPAPAAGTPANNALDRAVQQYLAPSGGSTNLLDSVGTFFGNALRPAANTARTLSALTGGAAPSPPTGASAGSGAPWAKPPAAPAVPNAPPRPPSSPGLLGTFSAMPGWQQATTVGGLSLGTIALLSALAGRGGLPMGLLGLLGLGGGYLAGAHGGLFDQGGQDLSRALVDQFSGAKPPEPTLAEQFAMSAGQFDRVSPQLREWLNRGAGVGSWGNQVTSYFANVPEAQRPVVDAYRRWALSRQHQTPGQ